VEGRRGRGRLKKKWLNEIECDMRTAGECVNDVGDRVKWKLKTKVSDPKKLGEYGEEKEFQIFHLENVEIIVYI